MAASSPMDLVDAARLLALAPQGRADASLAEFRSAVSEFTPADPAQASAARLWLNRWGCRIGYPRDAEDDVFPQNLSAWWSTWGGRLPDADLVDLDDRGIAALAAALEDLAVERADRRRTFGPTASAKLLFLVRPSTVTPWDAAIARRPGVDRDFGAHLRDARATATIWIDQAAGRSVQQIVGRPDSTLAKIVDEVLYLTYTRRLA